MVKNQFDNVNLRTSMKKRINVVFRDMNVEENRKKTNWLWKRIKAESPRDIMRKATMVICSQKHSRNLKDKNINTVNILTLKDKSLQNFCKS